MSVNMSYGQSSSSGSKANEYAINTLQQLVTLAIGTLVLSLTFLKDITGSSEATTFWLVPIGWLFLGASIWFGWVSMAEGSKQINLQGDGIYVFAAGRLKWLARIAQWSFFLGLICVGYFTVNNFNTKSTDDTLKKPSVQSNYFGSFQSHSRIRIDSVGAIGGFHEGNPTLGYDKNRLEDIIKNIRSNSAIATILIFGEEDNKERGTYASRISSARARFIKSQMLDACREQNITIVTLVGGGTNRQVVIYALMKQ